MSATFVHELQRNGPESVETFSEQEARAWVVRLAHAHYENFSVLSALAPRDLRDDFAAVYAFCRWADDLADEVADRSRSLELLEWWRRELAGCFDGAPRHPVFVALRPTVRRHNLPIRPFEDLISAFEQDQTVTRYESWARLIDYCRRSADPVGRLVLSMLGEECDDETLSLSDCICTALQLTNHWQDVKRDLLERDRVYVPREVIGSVDFEDRFRRSARQGWGVDHRFLEESRQVIRACVERTWPLFERGETLLLRLGPAARPVVWLFLAGGVHMLRRIESWNFETALHRPSLSVATKATLVARAWVTARLRVGGRTAR